MYDLSSLRMAVLLGSAEEAAEATRAALGDGVEPILLIDQAVGPAMEEVGRRFEAGDYFVPELLIAARATKAVFELIQPLLTKTGAKPKGRVALGTVQGDLHDIGKNLVGAMLEGSGFEVVDLGVDVSPGKFVAAVEAEGIQLIGLSCLLTTTMPAMAMALEAFAAAGIRDRVKVMIGGAPVNQSFADSIGADGYGANAAAAVDVARTLVSG
jgi:5-methyltetrahydrofolate--homocysteine methyltransferase